MCPAVTQLGELWGDGRDSNCSNSGRVFAGMLGGLRPRWSQIIYLGLIKGTRVRVREEGGVMDVGEPRKSNRLRVS